MPPAAPAPAAPPADAASDQPVADPDRQADADTQRSARRGLPSLLRWRPGAVAWLLVGLVIGLATFGLALAYLAPSAEGQRVSVDQLLALAEEGRVVQATFLDEDGQIVGTFVDGATSVAFRVDTAGSDSTSTLLLQALAANEARVEVDPQPVKAAVRLVATVLLPVLLLADLFGLLFLLARGGGGAADVERFGRLSSRGGRAVEPPAARFADVAGADEAVTELQEVVTYLREPQRYAGLGASPPKGVLLFGPPGTGKTLLARATAGEAGVPFFSVAGAEFVESLVGVGAARVRDLFVNVREAAPAILFIDELDAAGRRRGGGDASGGSDEREQTLNQLLVEIDGFDVDSGIVVMGATNRPDILDPALLRPGRFDRHITVDQPDVAGRSRILQLHADGKPLAEDVDLEQLARRTPGFTGADLANVVNEGALLAIRDGRQRIGAADLAEAVQRVLSGPQRRGRLLTGDERHRIATHEVGHAVAVAATRGAEEVQRLSIVARGRGLGSVQLGSDHDAVLLTRTQLEAQLIGAVGGRAAEELRFGEPSTGSDADLEVATALAQDLAARHGMSETLGRVRWLAPEVDLHLGGVAALRPCSGATLEHLDREVVRQVEGAFATATAVHRANRGLLDGLVERLLDQETLEGPELVGELRRVRPVTTSDPDRDALAGDGRTPSS